MSSSNRRVLKSFTCRNMTPNWSMDIPFRFGRDSTPGGGFPARSFLSGSGLTFSRSLDLAGAGRCGAVIGGSAEGSSLAAGLTFSIATHFTIGTPTFTGISVATRLLAAETAACAVMPRGRGAHLPPARELAGASPPPQDSEAAPPPPCDPGFVPPPHPQGPATSAPLAA